MALRRKRVVLLGAAAVGALSCGLALLGLMGVQSRAARAQPAPLALPCAPRLLELERAVCEPVTAGELSLGVARPRQ